MAFNERLFTKKKQKTSKIISLMEKYFRMTSLSTSSTSSLGMMNNTCFFITGMRKIKLLRTTSGLLDFYFLVILNFVQK